MYPVNRRRGVAYLAGKVESDSAYVRYIHFGQYYSADEEEGVQAGQVISASQPYYPSFKATLEDNDEPSVENENNRGLIRITDENNTNNEGIALGQQVAGSFLLNRTGFHSDLSPKTDSNGVLIESDSTVGLHNFWVGAYVNLLGKVNGNGTSLDTTVNLFKENGEVRHDYSQGDLALTALDDGYVFSSDKDTPWMEQFRDKYTNETGRVPYLGRQQRK